MTKREIAQKYIHIVNKSVHCFFFFSSSTKCDLRYLIGSPKANTFSSSVCWRIEISSVVNRIKFHEIKFRNRIADNARDAILRAKEWAAKPTKGMKSEKLKEKVKSRV